MDNGSRDGESQEINSLPVKKIKPSGTIFFLNNDLVRLVHSNKASNICILYNFSQDKTQNMLYTDFKKHRKRAYSIANTLRIFKRSRIQLDRWIKKGIVRPPTGTLKNGERKFTKLSYYSEDDLFTIRQQLATIHKGRPRKDGYITASKDIPTEKELRSLIGDAIMLYTKTEDGRFIPVWQEETW